MLPSLSARRRVGHFWMERIMRKDNYLMNCLWYEDITPEEAASAIGLTTDRFFDKVFNGEEFTAGEEQKLTELLNLTEEEVNTLFRS